MREKDVDGKTSFIFVKQIRMKREKWLQKGTKNIYINWGTGKDKSVDEINKMCFNVQSVMLIAASV